ncbi:MAG: Minf_1886 family protein [Planctomycetota bacterium]|jgi:uncharacterized repeat protein (TIGR04138 family)
MDLMQKITEVARKDGRYTPEAFFFLFKALEAAAKKGRGEAEEEVHHITGGQLLESIRLLALKEFGYLGRTVFESWGIRSTRDFGEAVFLMVRENLMGKNEEDRIEDFDDVFDFEEVFEKSYAVDFGQFHS